MMQSSYYSNKLPQYENDLKNGTRTLATFNTIRKALYETCRKYNIMAISAHNARFDYSALTSTQRYLTKSKYRYFFPKNVEICDTLKMARDVIGKMPTYIKFCEYHGFLTKNGKPQLKAETLYRFITNDPTYIESHTALEDVLIEKEILAYCYRQHKKMRRKLWD
jgi:DNA polymerase III epsilon subunit-like protein